MIGKLFSWFLFSVMFFLMVGSWLVVTVGIGFLVGEGFRLDVFVMVLTCITSGFVCMDFSKFMLEKM